MYFREKGRVWYRGGRHGREILVGSRVGREVKGKKIGKERKNAMAKKRKRETEPYIAKRRETEREREGWKIFHMLTCTEIMSLFINKE